MELPGKSKDRGLLFGWDGKLAMWRRSHLVAPELELSALPLLGWDSYHLNNSAYEKGPFRYLDRLRWEWSTRRPRSVGDEVWRHSGKIMAFRVRQT